MSQEFSLMEHEVYREAYEKWTGIKLQLDQAEVGLQMF